MGPALQLSDVSFVRDSRTILASLSWQVGDAERWLVLGANGSGKTTLLRIASLYEHPSTGTVDVLGERLGRTDVRRLRQRIGYLSASLSAQLRPELRCLDVVMTAKYAALEPWWHRYTLADEQRARGVQVPVRKTRKKGVLQKPVALVLRPMVPNSVFALGQALMAKA